MEKIVVANLKMNLTVTQISNYLEDIKEVINSKKVVICPTSIYLPYFLKNRYSVGIQNIAVTEEGAFTGEVSASQVSSMGIKYAIVGHSERRQLFNETDTEINKKVLLGIKNNLTIILCIGETKEEKDMLKTDKILKRQLINDLRDIDNKDIKNIIIAYEPIWSIGTGNVPENKEIITITKYIKGIVNNIYHEEIDIPVLYGGSVNEKNIEELNKINNISGVLVGGASLKADKLKKIKEVIIGE